MKNTTIALISLTFLASCQAHQNVSQRQELSIGSMIAQSQIKSAKGDFVLDRQGAILSALNMSEAMGEQAGFWDGCLKADYSIIKESLASTFSMSEPPSDVLQQIEYSWNKGFQKGRIAVCRKLGVMDSIARRSEESQDNYEYYECSMIWYHGANWEKSNYPGSLLAQQTGTNYPQFMKNCNS